ncbi:MAG: DUF2157 domain-containing protein [Chitinophagaceae bacterium]
MDSTLFEKLHAENLISNESLLKVKEAERHKLFSLHWELRTIPYLGVLLLTGGLGVLIYKNIDTIGHTAIVLFIAAVSLSSFVYCFKTAHLFHSGKVAAPNPFFDYILLLACLSFVTLIGYVQYQYHLFGNRYGLATFIPMLVLFASAYYFDHLGILSLAITSLCAWAGITVTPTRILEDNDFNNNNIIITGLVLGAGLLALAFATKLKAFKPHFTFTYTNFGMHIIFISTLAGMFNFTSIYFLWFLLLAAISFYFYRQALQQKSFYILLITTLYAFIGLSYVVVRLLFYTLNADMGGVYLTLMYFIAAGICLILFLIKMNRKIKAL